MNDYENTYKKLKTDAESVDRERPVTIYVILVRS